MEKKILTIPPELPIDTVLSELHMDRKHKLFNRISTICESAARAAKPVAIYSAFTPEIRDNAIFINGILFKEPFVHKMLAGNDIVIPYVATCGPELEEWSQTYHDMFDKFAADAIKECYLDAVRDSLLSEVQEKYFDPEKSISRINPGSLNEWPITGQIPLFKALGGVTGDIGVELKDSLLMVPVKSVSGIIFQTDTPYHNCQLCPRANCPGRTAPYEGD